MFFFARTWISCMLVIVIIIMTVLVIQKATSCCFGLLGWFIAVTLVFSNTLRVTLDDW